MAEPFTRSECQAVFLAGYDQIYRHAAFSVDR